MTWGIIFIIIAVAMALGPIMMFRPNSHTRRLEALRAEAAASGLKIRTVTYESRNQKRSVVVYSQPCETPFDVSILQRQDISHDIHFHQHWDWNDNKKPALSALQKTQLIEFINRLPKTVIGVEFSANSIGLWWQEKTVEQWGMSDLIVSLESLKKIIAP